MKTMRKVLLLCVTLILSGYVFGQTNQGADAAKNKFKSFPSSFTNEDITFIQDSVHVYTAAGKLKAREFNFFNEDHLESYSLASSVDYTGKESFIAMDSFFYDNNKNVELYKVYKIVDGEWHLEEYSKHYWNDFGKKDSTDEMKFDPDLAEWKMVRKQTYAYNEEGSLTEMTYYALDPIEFMLVPDMKFIYSEFIDIDKPKKAISSLYGSGKWNIYMNQYNEYDEKKRWTSNIFKSIQAEGEDINVKKIEWAYNDNDQVTEELEYGTDYLTKEFVKRTLIKNVYDPENHYLVADSSFSYNAKDNIWRHLTEMRYFWSKVVLSSISGSEYVSNVNAYYDVSAKQIHVKANESISDIYVYSIEGHQIAGIHTTQNSKETSAQNEYTISVKNIPPGIYIVKLNSQNKSFCQKIYLYE